MTEADVKLKLAEMEAEKLLGGAIPVHETSASAFIVNGLDLEEQQ